MKMMKLNTIACVGLLLVPLVGCAGEDRTDAKPAEAPWPEPVAAAGPARPSGISTGADKLLRQSTTYLKGLKSFTVRTEHTTEVVLQSGAKMALAGSAAVSVKRPNKLKSERRGELTDGVFFYDGETISIYGKKQNMWAQTQAPKTIDETIDFARDRLNLEAPAADLLFSSPYEVLMADMDSGEVAGIEEIDGVPCHHLVYRGDVVDWELWIQDGDTPLPRKYKITSKDVAGAPEFSVTLRDWNTNAEIPDSEFAFEKPPNAQRIDFLEVVPGSAARDE
jgi:hypothetical protein